MRKPRKLPLEVLAPFVYEPAAPATPIDWHRLFGNDRPVEVEVGFGKGTFLVEAATASPETNYFGIEIERKYHFYTAGRLARRGLGNARACCADAKALLAGAVADASVEVVHVYFPDPWWKRRHWKRRLFTPDFARTCLRILRPGGLLSVATDVEEYFGVMTETLAGLTDFERGESVDPVAITNFERKALEKGGAVYRAAYRKDSSPGQQIVDPFDHEGDTARVC